VDRQTAVTDRLIFKATGTLGDKLLEDCDQFTVIKRHGQPRLLELGTFFLFE
jgi:hypothetical protein